MSIMLYTQIFIILHTENLVVCNSKPVEFVTTSCPACFFFFATFSTPKYVISRCRPTGRPSTSIIITLKE